MDYEKLTTHYDTEMDRVTVESGHYIVEVRLDGDKNVGIIVDVWDKESGELIDTECYWNDDSARTERECSEELGG